MNSPNIMEDLTGFDSETDRRDAVRRQIVDEAVQAVYAIIQQHAVTATAAERSYLELAVTARLMQSLKTDACSQVMREELTDDLEVGAQ